MGRGIKRPANKNRRALKLRVEIRLLCCALIYIYIYRVFNATHCPCASTSPNAMTSQGVSEFWSALYSSVKGALPRDFMCTWPEFVARAPRRSPCSSARSRCALPRARCSPAGGGARRKGGWWVVLLLIRSGLTDTPRMCASPVRTPWRTPCGPATRIWTRRAGASRRWSRRWTESYGNERRVNKHNLYWSTFTVNMLITLLY